MKIAIIGYSGSGKSTLAQRLGKIYGIDVLHFDRVQFLPGWEVRSQEEKLCITEEFLNTHDAWVIDGTYSKLAFDRRMEEADEIVILLFNRFTCLFRAYRRYRRYADATRPDMAEGCKEKFDWVFVKWILWQGRTRAHRERFRQNAAQYRGKVVVIRNQKQLDAYLASVEERNYERI